MKIQMTEHEKELLPTRILDAILVILTAVFVVNVLLTGSQLFNNTNGNLWLIQNVLLFCILGILVVASLVVVLKVTTISTDINEMKLIMKENNKRLYKS